MCGFSWHAYFWSLGLSTPASWIKLCSIYFGCGIQIHSKQNLLGQSAYYLLYLLRHVIREMFLFHLMVIYLLPIIPMVWTKWFNCPTWIVFTYQMKKEEKGREGGGGVWRADQWFSSIHFCLSWTCMWCWNSVQLTTVRSGHHVGDMDLIILLSGFGLLIWNLLDSESDLYSCN